MNPAQQRAARRERLLPIEFDPALPVNGKRDAIRAAIERHPVVIVCGETGSGKTTQLPKILLEMGRGVAGLIGHTQPRRIAARSVAARLAEELKTAPGEAVGYKVRFNDQVKAESLVKLMTDGILLAETQGDRQLRAYDTIILDEAHERSLNIDFLLGYLKRLVLGPGAPRPDLKLVITSATIDAERFSRHFGGAPVIEVSGRLYPVEIRYRNVEGDAEDTTREEEEQALADAVDELCREGPGDVLVFLPGEREIRDAAEVLRKHHPPGVEILPLYARLSAAEQDRVFRPGSARRIVLATNVAETSLTVPRIRYVVDTGLARVKRYSYRNKVEMLRVEPVSQAAARQRAGRCGRVADGVCIRLYEQTDHDRRPAFTDPELLRSSLATVILRATSLGLGPVEAFEFLDPPQARAISDGYALLQELAAVDEARALTETGRVLAKLPLDPRVGRMLVAARAEGCLEQVLVIAAAMSVQDPRQRPLAEAGAADARHQAFADPRSDFLGMLKLWAFFAEALAHRKSNRKLVQLCRAQFLSIGRMREWRDVHAQLAANLDELGWKATGVDPAKPEGYAAIHRALLAGLLGNVGLRELASAPDAQRAGESGVYTGARGIKFRVHPGSGTKKPGRWVVAAELVETTRLYARTVASIEPRWLEQVGAHLIKRHHDAPHWEKNRAQVVAQEQGTLYGLPVYVNRRVHYGPLAPGPSREVFLRAALVEGEFDCRAPFFAHNQRLVREIERLEHKARRPDILVDDELIYAFYDDRVPEGIHNGADFERWRKAAERDDPKLLFLAREDLMRHRAAGITSENFPPTLELGANRYALEYHFEPGEARDGVTMTVPVALLNQVPAARCEWLVPGLLAEKVRALVKTMPQRLRHKLGPLDAFAQAFAAAVEPGDVPLAQALARYVRDAHQLELPQDAIRADGVPPHLRMNWRVLDEHGRQLAIGRDLAQLKQAWAPQVQALLADAAPAPEAEQYRSWSFGDLAEMMELRRGGQTLVGYPALADEGDAVSIQLFDSPEAAQDVHRQGVHRLLRIVFRERIRELTRQVGRDNALRLLFAQLAPEVDAGEEIVAASIERCFLADGLPVTQSDFERRVEEGRSRFSLIAQEIVRLVSTILAEHAQAKKRLSAAAKAYPEVARDVTAQLERLLAPHFVSATPWERLQHFPRYLKAAGLRLDKLRADPARDARQRAALAPLETAWQREYASRARLGTISAELEQFRWLLEELRVSLFAQELRTPVPVSAKRLGKMWQSMRRL